MGLGVNQLAELRGVTQLRGVTSDVWTGRHGSQRCQFIAGFFESTRIAIGQYDAVRWSVDAFNATWLFGGPVAIIQFASYARRVACGVATEMPGAQLSSVPRRWLVHAVSCPSYVYSVNNGGRSWLDAGHFCW